MKRQTAGTGQRDDKGNKTTEGGHKKKIYLRKQSGCPNVRENLDSTPGPPGVLFSYSSRTSTLINCPRQVKPIGYHSLFFLKLTAILPTNLVAQRNYRKLLTVVQTFFAQS